MNKQICQKGFKKPSFPQRSKSLVSLWTFPGKPFSVLSSCLFAAYPLCCSDLQCLCATVTWPWALCRLCGSCQVTPVQTQAVLNGLSSSLLLLDPIVPNFLHPLSLLMLLRGGKLPFPEIPRRNLRNDSYRGKPGCPTMNIRGRLQPKG